MLQTGDRVRVLLEFDVDMPDIRIEGWTGVVEEETILREGLFMVRFDPHCISEEVRERIDACGYDPDRSVFEEGELERLEG